MEISAQNQADFLVKTKQAKLVIKSDGKIEVEASPEPIIIAGPGEYEVKGFIIFGYKNSGYLIEAEEIKVGYMTDKEEVDVLITNSWETAKNAQPSVVIPVDGKVKSELVKASGLEARQEKKLVLTKVGLTEETELVILERKA
jgi:hypothetical protein